MQTALVGSILLAASIAGFKGYVSWRTHPRPMDEQPTGIDPQPAEAPEEPAAQALPPPPDPPSALPATANGAGSPPPVTASASLGDETGDTPDPTARRRQQLLTRRRGQIIQAADEQVFDALKVPGTARDAIRAADRDYARAIEAGTGGNPALDADLTRRTAIANVLDPEAMHAFNLAERQAERWERTRLRPDLVRGR